MPPSNTGVTRTRRVQSRAVETQLALLDTAIDSFSRRGYDGVSVRQIEEDAGVNRGLVAYHFGDKAELWRRAVDRLFNSIGTMLTRVTAEAAQRDETQLSRALARAFVTYSADKPALNRLMMQESMQSSWRVDYLVSQHIKPMLGELRAAHPGASASLWGHNDPHRYYLFVGAAAFAFSAAEECRALFGVSPTDPEFIERHADLVLATLFR